MSLQLALNRDAANHTFEMTARQLTSMWHHICGVFGVPHTSESTLQLYPDDVLCMTLTPKKFVRLKRHHVYSLYKQWPTDLLQVLIRPVIQPGPVHLMICLRYDNALLDMFKGQYGMASRVELIRRHVHRLLRPLVQELLHPEPAELIARVFDQSHWISRCSGSETAFVAHYPLLKLGGIADTRTLMTSFLSLMRKVETQWARIAGGIPLVYDSLHVFDLTWYLEYGFSAMPFEGDVWNEKMWHSTTCTKPEYGVTILHFLPNFCSRGAVCLEMQSLNAGLLENAYKVIMSSACSDEMETTRLSCSSLNRVLKDANSAVRFNGSVIKVAAVFLELITTLATEKQHLTAANVQEHLDTFQTQHPFATVIIPD